MDVIRNSLVAEEWTWEEIVPVIQESMMEEIVTLENSEGTIVLWRRNVCGLYQASS